jgi:hypothetical protein
VERAAAQACSQKAFNAVFSASQTIEALSTFTSISGLPITAPRMDIGRRAQNPFQDRGRLATSLKLQGAEVSESHQTLTGGE